MGDGEYQSVTVHGEMIVAARIDGQWSQKTAARPGGHGTAEDADADPQGGFLTGWNLWLGAREEFIFRDQGKTWLWIQRLPFRDVDDLSYDAALSRMLVSSRTSGQCLHRPEDHDLQWWQAVIRSR